MEFFNFSTNIRVRLITNFLDSTIVSSAMPFMALYFSDEINKATAGIILTVGIFLRLFFGFFGGYFTDRLGRKKQLLFGQFIYILSMSLLAIFIMPSINFAWGIAFVFFISSISNAVRHPALEAMIIDDTNEGNRKKVYLYSAWSYNLSLALGTVIGGLFYLKYKEFLFIGIVCISILNFISYLFLLSETHINLKAKKHNNIIKDIFSTYYSVAKNRKYLMYTTSLIFISSAEFALSNYIGVHLHDEFKSIFIGDFEINGIRMMNIMTIINTIMVVTSTFIIGNLFKKFNEQFILILGVLIYIISYGVSHYSLNIYILILCIIIATFGELMFAPVYSVLQARFMPEDQKGSYLAFSSLGNSGASMLASSGLIMGALLGSFNMMILVIFYGIIGIILLFLSTKNLH